MKLRGTESDTWSQQAHDHLRKAQRAREDVPPAAGTVAATDEEKG